MQKSFLSLPLAAAVLMAAALCVRAQNRPATPANLLAVPPGFKIELLHSATTNEGSWICLAVDAKGRLIVSPQDDKFKYPLQRITLTAAGQFDKIETIDQPVWAAMGLLYAFDSLYVSGNGTNGLGIYRLSDTNGDDQFDKLEFLRKIDGAAGEHGSHALVLGPDKMIYQIHGNFVGLPKDLAANSPHRDYADDRLLPRAEDGNGFGAGRKPPGGFILRMDRDAKTTEMIAAGMRNTYDFAFNADGEMFCYDSDMEWDWGTPWYRPTRIYHLVSGGDYGFREGTAKWPAWYPDALPPVLDIGIGSPTGVQFGTGAKFPEKYQRALYAMDWSYGRIVAVHLTPKGASYSAMSENFVAPALAGKTPLNVTDLEIGRDGAMYFTTGGRGTQAGLYRVSYTGDMTTSPAGGDAQASTARNLRRRLEAFHTKQDPRAVDFAWRFLNSPDRYLRYAARLAIENQPVAQWQQRALDESSVEGSLTALLALARKGPTEVQKDLLEALGRHWPDGLDEEQKLAALRVCQLAFIRMGRPDEETAKDVIKSLNAHYPNASERLNLELCQLLVYLEAPDAVKKTLGLLSKAETQEEQLSYIFYLRTLKTGWTMDERKAYFGWFNKPRETADGGPTYPGGASYTIVKNTKHPAATTQWFKDVGRDFGDGASFPKFMANIRKDAVATLTDAERAELAPLITADLTPAKTAAKPKVRQFVREWTTADILPTLDQAGRNRNFARGKEAFEAAQCLACHRFGSEGGSTGPDITAISSRFARRDLLESITEPSKVVSEQYQNITVTKKDGDDVTGRLLEETDYKLVLLTDALKNTKVEVNASAVARREVSKLSPMPEGLMNILSQEEILDLLAYIESAGKKDHAAFREKP